MKKIIVAVVLLLPIVTSAATLSISPNSRSINAGDTFSVTVNLDTQGASIDGIDLRYLNYNPSILQLQDGNSSVAGVQIAPGNLMPMTLANSVDTSLGKITFSQVAALGNKYKGSGILATLTFKALSGGTANLTFNYTSGNTTDSNVASGGTDILSAVINGSYNVTGSASSVGTFTPYVPQKTTTPVPTIQPTKTPTNLSTVTKITRNLKLNDQGQDVLLLQKTLNSLGYQIAATGSGSPGHETILFGASTKEALIKYQTDRVNSSGLNPTGVLDNATLFLINSDTAKLLAAKEKAATSTAVESTPNPTASNPVISFFMRIFNAFMTVVDKVSLRVSKIFAW